jgi:8-oxo-dGTP diphosphatase
MDAVVRVGIGVVVVQDGKVLLGQRKNSHGAGSWSLPGGHLEIGESFQECARREVFEETGLHVSDIIQGPTSNDIFLAEQKHYVTIVMVARGVQGTPRVCEPHKCSRWEWFAPNNLPSPLFLPLENCIKNGLDFQQYIRIGHTT